MRARLLAAFAAVYLVWGSTYLAIRFAVETLPPLLMAGARFTTAGIILLLWARARGQSPTRADWRTGFLSGVLLLVGGNGGVAWAEQRVPSGITAVLVAIVPVLMVLLDWLRPGGRRPHTLVVVGLALGLAGFGLLVGAGAAGNGNVNFTGAVVLLFASLSWAAGSLYTKHAPRASGGLVGAATQMICGGLSLAVVGSLAGEFASFDPAHVSTRSLLGMLYLITFGSLVGFTAYVYLLNHTTAAKASTYAYVNPVVAVFLGWMIGHESVTLRTLAATAIILSGVAIITVARDRDIPVERGARAAA